MEVAVRIAVVRLSDIHFQANSNVLVSRVEKISAAIRPTLQQVQGVVFVVTLLGKNLLPAYPVIVLAILQSYSTSRTANSSAGSYGQMYEALITTALASVSKKAVELGTKYTYISRIAYHMFHANAKELGPSDL